MRKIIGGKRYNTGTAEYLATVKSSCVPGEPHYWEEKLYRKQTGEYFLHGRGGKLSRYSEMTADNEWIGSGKIIPLSDEAARAWAEEHLEEEERERVLRIDEGRSTTLSIYILESIADEARERAEERGWPISRLVATAVREWLERV